MRMNEISEGLDQSSYLYLILLIILDMIIDDRGTLATTQPKLNRAYMTILLPRA